MNGYEPYLGPGYLRTQLLRHGYSDCAMKKVTFIWVSGYEPGGEIREMIDAGNRAPPPVAPPVDELAEDFDMVPPTLAPTLTRPLARPLAPPLNGVDELIAGFGRLNLSEQKQLFAISQTWKGLNDPSGNFEPFAVADDELGELEDACEAGALVLSGYYAFVESDEEKEDDGFPGFMSTGPSGGEVLSKGEILSDEGDLIDVLIAILNTD